MRAKGTMLLQADPAMNCVETGAPFFSIQYKPSAKPETARAQSYRILSLLKGSNEIIVELNSALFMLPATERERQTLEYRRSFGEFGVENRGRSSPAPQEPFSLASLFRKDKNPTQYETWYYIPNDIWGSSGFSDVIPIVGARYFILKDGINGSKALEAIFNGQLDPESKRNTLSLNVFDCNVLGQMGIISYDMDCQTLNERLSPLPDGLLKRH